MFKTACESPDLNMDFRSFDNGLNSFTNRYLCKNNNYKPL